MSEQDKPPDIITMEELLRHLVVEGDCTDAVVRIAMFPGNWVVTPPVIHQHLLVEGQPRKRDLRVDGDVFREACEKGYLTGKVKGPVISCTERVISHKGLTFLLRCRTTTPAK